MWKVSVRGKGVKGRARVLVARCTHCPWFQHRRCAMHTPCVACTYVTTWRHRREAGSSAGTESWLVAAGTESCWLVADDAVDWADTRHVLFTADFLVDQTVQSTTATASSSTPVHWRTQVRADPHGPKVGAGRRCRGRGGRRQLPPPNFILS